jgi:hypothetical protein
MGMTRILRFARLRYIVMEERYAQFAALFSIRRDHQDGGPIMKRLGMLGIIGGAAILTAVPFSLQWSQKNVTLSLASAEAQERPLTATSVAGVSRRAHRRAYRSAAYASAAGYGYRSYSGYGYPAYSTSYWIPYGTSYAAPYGIYSSSYAIARERLQSGYAAPYGPIFY